MGRMIRVLLLSLSCALVAGGPLRPNTAGSDTVPTPTGTCTPIASLPATIDASGSYCLTQNLSYGEPTGAAITIAADHVTLDLNGFRLMGIAARATTQAEGIRADNRRGLTIRNGTLRGFRRGVRLGNTGDAWGNAVSELRLEANAQVGVESRGRGSIVRGNRILDTGGSGLSGADTPAWGILVAGPGMNVRDNEVSDTHARSAGEAVGIEVRGGAGVVVEGNRVRQVSPAGSSAVKVTGATTRAFVVANVIANATNKIHCDAAAAVVATRANTGLPGDGSGYLFEGGCTRQNGGGDT